MKTKRLILFSAALMVIATALLILWSNHRQGSISVTLEGVRTNSAGESEYLFRVQNNAWNAFVLADVKTQVGPNEKTHTDRKNLAPWTREASRSREKRVPGSKSAVEILCGES